MVESFQYRVRHVELSTSQSTQFGLHLNFRSFDRNDARTFFDHHNLACRNSLEALLQPTRPTNVEIDRGLRSEAKVQPRIVRRVKAGLADNLLRLCFAPIMR